MGTGIIITHPTAKKLKTATDNKRNELCGVRFNIIFVSIS